MVPYHVRTQTKGIVVTGMVVLLLDIGMSFFSKTQWYMKGDNDLGHGVIADKDEEDLIRGRRQDNKSRIKAIPNGPVSCE